MQRGSLRVHVDRLTTFLESQRLDAFDPSQRNLVRLVLTMLAAGKIPRGDWRPHVNRVAANREVVRDAFWKDLRDAVSAGK